MTDPKTKDTKSSSAAGGGGHGQSAPADKAATVDDSGRTRRSSNFSEMTPREKWQETAARALSKEHLISPTRQPASHGRDDQLSPLKKANGRVKPDLKRNDSLSVPGTGKIRPKTPQKRRPAEALGSKDLGDSTATLGEKVSESRRSSARSVDSKASNVDFARLQNAPVVQAKKEEEEKSKSTIQTDDLYIRSVIPYMPQWLAVICLLLNVFIPGSGTMLCGFSTLCCGKPRVQSKEGHTMITLCVNVLVGCMQLFTTPFMLVGWFWAFVWGVYMLILAAEHKDEEKQRREKELQANALTALNANLRPWTLMRS